MTKTAAIVIDVRKTKRYALAMSSQMQASKSQTRFDLSKVFGIDDPREVPAYSIPEAAHYLCMPAQTIRAWVKGTTYTHGGKSTFFKPVIQLPESATNLLTFFNLAEVHVLRAMRTKHTIQLQDIRKALQFVQDRFGWDRPLLMQQFKTDGAALFVEQLGKLIDVTAGGQTVMRAVLAHLERIEWDSSSIAARLYPFTRRNLENAPKSVLIDPRYSFGRPILAKTHIATGVIADRYKAGESIADLADDYGCSHLEIEEGVRCELRLSAA